LVRLHFFITICHDYIIVIFSATNTKGEISVMKDKARLTIGLMLHYLDNDYSRLLLQGATAAAEELDVNLVIIPGRSLNCQLHDRKYTEYEYQNNAIYSFASEENLDALVISAGTVGQFVTREEFKQFVDSYEGLPVLTMECAVRGYPCIRLVGSGMKTMVAHLIHEHGKKNIAFVSGPKGNTDAEERLAYYREALEENGIAYDPSLVVYAKFSEFCDDLVGELLDRNEGRIDAICFANDMMCKGGYRAIESRGLVVGRDIAVTGYDDSEIATSLTPMLTTIRADATLLGSCAVREAVQLARGEQVQQMVSLSSSLVIRQSCGCASFWSDAAEGRAELVRSSSSEILTSMVMTEYIPDALTNSSPVVEDLRRQITLLFEYARLPEENDPSDQQGIFESLLSRGLIHHISADSFVDLLKSVRYIAVTLCGDDTEKIIAIHHVIEYGYDAVAAYMLKRHSSMMDDLTFTHFLISNITKDMTVNGNDEVKCYRSVMNNLYRTHTRSSYIYSYGDPVAHTQDTEWRRPDKLFLKAYHDGDRIEALMPEQQCMDSLACISNSFTPDRRRTVILFPLFMNEEHYGVIVSEAELYYYGYIYSVAPQICTAIKLTRLVSRLESSLDAATSRNDQLNKISMYDELTGVYNRRGFYEFANRILTAPENDGKTAVLIFADLDNLKKINDSFGHEAGDHAIISAAGFLKTGLRNTDIVARIGGDEFAAFALCDEKIIAKIPQRIKQIAAEYNKNSDKEFNVTMSIGTYTLDCGATQNIHSYMDRADTALYEDKKHKSYEILK